MRHQLIFATFCLLIAAIPGQLQATPTATINSLTTSGSTATVDITAVNFTGITATDMTILYNPAVATPTSVTIGTGLSGSITVNLTNPGVIRFGWYTFAGVTMPANSVIFKIQFSRANYGTTSLTFSDPNGYDCEFYDQFFNPMNDSPMSSYWVDGSLTFSGGNVKLSPKLFLKGPYNTSTGLMTDNLRTSALIPGIEPFTGLGYTLVYPGGGEAINSGVLSTSGNNAVTDWVLLELRSSSDPTSVVASRAALVQRDGDVVDMDNSSPVTFTGVAPGSYYVAVKHRNHLGVMSGSAIALSATATNIDFTATATPVYGSNARIQLVSGIWGLWPGNASGSGNTVIYSGSGNDPSLIFNAVINASGNTSGLPNYILSGYLATDLNMDGNTIYSGSGNDVSIIFNTILAHPGNTAGLTNYIITEQVP